MPIFIYLGAYVKLTLGSSADWLVKLRDRTPANQKPHTPALLNTDQSQGRTQDSATGGGPLATGGGG